MVQCPGSQKGHLWDSPPFTTFPGRGFTGSSLAYSGAAPINEATSAGK